MKFVRLLRLVRMLRLAKLKTIWERMEIRIGSVYIIQCISLLRVLCVVVAMCHWSACLFWLIGLPRNLFTELMSDEEHHDLQMVGDCGARAEDRSAEGAYQS